MTPTQLIGQLISQGGAIVGSNDCSVMEITNAQATGRFAVDLQGFGYVIRSKEWLALQKAREIAHPNTGGKFEPAAVVEQLPINQPDPLPCPFCGRIPRVTERGYHDHCGQWVDWVCVCCPATEGGCGCHRNDSTEAGAWKKWNTRPL